MFQNWCISEGFASGLVIPSNFTEILLCQSYFNSEVIMVREPCFEQFIGNHMIPGFLTTFPKLRLSTHYWGGVKGTTVLCHHHHVMKRNNFRMIVHSLPRLVTKTFVYH